MAGFSEKLYSHLPVWMQHVGISLYGISWRQERMGGMFATYVAEFTARDRISPDAMNAYTTQELRKLVLHAYENVPYYRQKWHTLGIEGGDLAQITPETLHC